MVTRRHDTATTPTWAPKRRKAFKPDPTLWKDIAALFVDVPEEEWVKLPRDGSKRLDEYLDEQLP